MAAPQETKQRRRNWGRQIAIWWLGLSYPFFLLFQVMVMHWESTGGGSNGICGRYPCGIPVALAMIFVIIPGGAIASVATLVWLFVTRARGQST